MQAAPIAHLPPTTCGLTDFPLTFGSLPLGINFYFTWRISPLSNSRKREEMEDIVNALKVETNHFLLRRGISDYKISLRQRQIVAAFPPNQTCGSPLKFSHTYTHTQTQTQTTTTFKCRLAPPDSRQSPDCCLPLVALCSLAILALVQVRLKWALQLSDAQFQSLVA